MMKKSISKFKLYPNFLTISIIIITGIYLNIFALKVQAQDDSNTTESTEESQDPVTNYFFSLMYLMHFTSSRWLYRDLISFTSEKLSIIYHIYR